MTRRLKGGSPVPGAQILLIRTSMFLIDRRTEYDNSYL